MKAIFLDIDGVLNDNNLCGEDFMAGPIGVLNAIIERSGAKVVISSGWRKVVPMEQIEFEMRCAGFKGEIIGETPCLYGYCAEEVAPRPMTRGDEIQEWVNLPRPEGRGFREKAETRMRSSTPRDVEFLFLRAPWSGGPSAGHTTVGSTAAEHGRSHHRPAVLAPGGRPSARRGVAAGEAGGVIQTCSVRRLASRDRRALVISTTFSVRPKVSLQDRPERASSSLLYPSVGSSAARLCEHIGSLTRRSDTNQSGLLPALKGEVSARRSIR